MTDETPIKYLERADFLIEVNRWREAIAEIVKHLAVFPEDYDALCQMALCYYELSELKTALEFAKKAAAAEPELEWAYRLQSLIFRASGNNLKALEAAESCVRKAPYLIAPLQTFAYAQIDKFLLNNASNTAKTMLEIAPDASETHDVCGYLAMKNEDWETAEKHYKLSLQIEPLSYFTLNNLGNVYLNRSKIGWNFLERARLHRRAIECFQQSIKINPTFKLAQENLKVSKESGVVFTLPISKIAASLSRTTLFLGISFHAMYVYSNRFGITSVSWIFLIGGYLFLVIGAVSYVNYQRNKNIQ